MTVFHGLVNNIALMLTLGLVYGFVNRYWSDGSRQGQIISGLLFGGVAIGIMSTPLRIMPGILFDARSVVLSVVGLFGGPVPTGIAVVMAAAYRLWQGGVGAFAGILVIFVTASIGVLYHYWIRHHPQAMRPYYLYGFGVLVHAAMLPCMLPLSSSIFRHLIDEVALPIMLIFPVATLLLASLVAATKSKVELDQQLERSEKRFRDLAELLPQIIFETDEKGNITFANKQAYVQTGYTRQEVERGLNIVELLLPEDIDRAQKSIADILVDRDIHSEEYVILRKDGAEIIGLFRSSAIVRDGKPVGVRSSMVDITSWRRAEEKMLGQSRLLEAINRIFRQTLTLKTQEEVAATCLALAEELTGSQFGLIGVVNAKGLFDTLAISNPGWDACQMPDSEATKAIVDMELRGIDRATMRDEESRIVNDLTDHPDRVGFPEGHPPVTAFLGVPLKALDETIGMIGLGNKPGGYDRADQEAIEELSVAFVQALRRKQAEQALYAEEEKYRVLVEESPFAVCLIDQGNELRYVNPRFVDLFGYTLMDIPTLRSWFEKAVPDQEYREELIADWADNTKIEESELIAPRMLTATCKNGTKRQIQCWPVDMILGGYSVFCQDVTKEKRLEARLSQTQKMEAVGTLAGGIAHDFNNILAVIMGNAELGLENAKQGKANPREIEQIFTAAQRADDLVKQILTFSRKSEIKKEPLGLNQIVTASVKLIEQTIPKMINIETQLDQNIKSIEGNTTQIQQVLINLASNARDAMPDGGDLLIKTGNATIQNEHCLMCGDEFSGDYVLLSVSDTGHGMDEEAQNRMFDPFFTTKEMGKGTGLGLSITLGAISSLGGHCTCQSQPGQGTTFNIYLPQSSAETGKPADRSTVGENIPGGNETILLVDDEKNLLDLYKKVLSGKGYAALTAGSGEEAVAIYRENMKSIDLVILDISMPGMGGHQALKKILALDPRAKVLIASGYARNGSLDEVSNSGAAGRITKPFKRSDLLKTVREILDTPGQARDVQ